MLMRRIAATFKPIALEGICYFLGATLLIFGLSTMVHGELRAAHASQRLPDMQLWSQSARARYIAASAAEPQATLGILRIPRLALEVPVYANASELNLDRGAGVIDGMAYPHELGHIGIAGHRDGYFRAVKDVEIGDRIELDTLDGRKSFTVEHLRIIETSELSYLAETDDQRLTIVTCYPFYFAGSAPQRFLVQAVSISETDRTDNTHVPAGA